MKYQNVLELIGNTPLVYLKKFSKNLNSVIWAKLEYYNPAGSLKDRMVIQMITEAEEKGLLKPGGTIIEASSGNTGVALAMVGIVKGYRVIIIAPDRISTEKVSLLKAYGAEVVIAKGNVPHDSPESYYSVADRIASEIPGAYVPDQYRSHANANAHYFTTGRELWEQMDGELDAVVVGIGTGGTAMGVCKYLKEKNANIKVIGVDAEGSMLSEKSRQGEHLVEGLGIEFDSPFWEPDLLDDIILVENKDAILCTHELAREEGLLVGASSGAAACAARYAAQELPENSTIAVIFPDSGERYLSKYFNNDWLIKNNIV